MATTTELRILGMNEEQTTCDMCGRVELRGTVIIADTDGNEFGRYGTTCAGHAIGAGRKVTRDQARGAELARRQYAVDELRQALKSLANGDTPAAKWHVAHARKFAGLHRADELAIAARVDAA